MAYNYQQVPFWDFVRNFDPNVGVGAGAGVDHQPEAGFFGQGRGGPAGHPAGAPYGPWGFPFGGPGFGPGHAHTWGGPGPCGRGRRGRHHRREGSHEHEHEHEHHGSRDASPNHEQPDGEGLGEPREGSPHGHEHGPGHHGPRHSRRGGMGRGGWGGRGGLGGEWGGRGGLGGGWGRGGWGRGWGGQARAAPFPGADSNNNNNGTNGFDLSALIECLSAHPLAQAFRTYAEQMGATGRSASDQANNENAAEADAGVTAGAENTFTPPIDIFSTPSAYILHVALPGAKKEDVGVNWDAEAGALNLAGVVYRSGDEEFLKSLSQGERKVGVFERTVKLPPVGKEGEKEKEEVDGDAISARLEDGVLVVTVPKVEKEWTDIKRVDIE